ncbi:MAG: hypothetical protein OEY38_00705 [Gammaproteobacteria bacterium]|nr:hypothetical protein [Gammaproteobacteria bacterium]
MYAGSQQLEIFDQSNQLSFKVLLRYPSETVSSNIMFGPYSFDVSPEAVIAAGTFPLIVISHGTGGSHLLYRSIALYLSKKGYVAAQIEHPGNNRNNNELEGTLRNLEYRPKHISLTLDAIRHHKPFKSQVQTNNVAIIGQSIGGYTALAISGGIAWSKDAQKVNTEPDPRVKAMVLLALAAGFFQAPRALSTADIPILLNERGT